jgi:hypothetical protein
MQIKLAQNDLNIFKFKEIETKIEMDLAKLHYIFNIKMIKSVKGKWLLQKQYALNKLFEYGTIGYKPILVPLKSMDQL